ncbi:MAG TPA: hypothetical protein VJ851_11190 [Jatrophihabitans sp.]|nr:hypothetical protein [Jatrophihabitans sp.]
MRSHRILFIATLAAGALVVGNQLSIASGATSTGRVASSSQSSIRGVDCSSQKSLCVEVHDSDEVFGHYVGHDEPSLLFDSTRPGSGNQMRYSGILPKEPAPSNVPGQRSYDFNLYATFWFGMAMCATESYPNTVKSCIPDSDANIARPGSPFHPGSAYMELQFYPPGYVQQFNGFSCSGTRWCVALTIDSFAENPLAGTELNATCRQRVGVEYANFAYLTKSGVPQGPPNPVDFQFVGSGKPDPNKDLFLNQGDHFTVTLHDTAHGLQTVVHDTTTGATGSMTASAANGFGQVKYAPTGTSCTNLPYDFHPEYSTSTPKTTVPWAAATYNVAIDTEIGHFDYCAGVDTATGTCTGTEGAPGHQEKADADDQGCFPGSASTLIKVGGCLGTNFGYDGTSYLPDWPNGSASRPTATIFTSAKTGPNYNIQYPILGFNTDLPAIESSLSPACNGDTGANCTILPPTDDGAPANFYPYYSSGHALGGCAWTVGQDYPGFSTNDYGKLHQYGSLLKVTYPTKGGGTESLYSDFQKFVSNPCPAP